MTDLFKYGDFTLHSGDKASWKIDCDALSDADLSALAALLFVIFQNSEMLLAYRAAVYVLRLRWRRTRFCILM